MKEATRRVIVVIGMNNLDELEEWKRSILSKKIVDLNEYKAYLAFVEMMSRSV